MMVPVNQNIDSYKDDFFKGLTMRQTLFAVAAVVVSGGLLTFFLVYLKINASLAMYLTLPFAFPIIAAGFVRIHGIGLSDYLKRKKKVETQPSFFFQPEMIFWSNQGLLSSEEEALAPAKEKEGKDRIVFLDVPLLFESKAQKYCHEVWTIACDDEIRLKRILGRGDLTVKEAKKRIASQMPQEEKIALSDVVIYNNGSRRQLLYKLNKLIKER